MAPRSKASEALKPAHVTASASDGKSYGLVLTLGGAPCVSHTLPGLPGYYRPDRATPVGGPGEADLATAVEWSKRDGAPVSLVLVEDVQAARDAHDAELRAGRNALLHRRQDAASAGGNEPSIVTDETEATRG